MCSWTSFFFNYTATTEIYTYLHTLSLHDALPISNPSAFCCRPVPQFESLPLLSPIMDGGTPKNMQISERDSFCASIHCRSIGLSEMVSHFSPSSSSNTPPSRSPPARNSSRDRKSTRHTSSH